MRPPRRPRPSAVRNPVEPIGEATNVQPNHNGERLPIETFSRGRASGRNACGPATLEGLAQARGLQAIVPATTRPLAPGPCGSISWRAAGSRLRNIGSGSFSQHRRQPTPPATPPRHRRTFRSEHATGPLRPENPLIIPPSMPLAHRARPAPQKAQCRWTFRVRRRNRAGRRAWATARAPTR